ncbi:MATH domain and coiled-coil domain-containing protein At2g42470-like [Raphanus sativus]|uniref:MATH domain and coiled-coil domain-containing protein At2g42470-like n=1 Tax=Raphanus sativus TaxID=3726 RepID=A0A9W3BXL8_RAPSA|nr:MATH domain and coiled-coil domain-containing protein At2g42470-like [Raphanus sativus]
MEDQKQTSFTFEIDNFSEKEGLIRSPNFFSGGCEWFVDVYPKGYGIEDHLSTFLCVANPESLLLGWKRRAILSLVLSNESGKRLYGTFRNGPPCKTFCAQFPAWGWANAIPLEKLHENGFMEKNKLIVQLKVQVLEVVDEAEVTGKETLDVNGFQVLYCEVGQVTNIFAKHPDIALNFIPKSQLVKTTYMHLLMGLIEKLNKPPRSFTKNELSDTRMELTDLTKAGFKLDWLKEKLDEISLEWKKSNDDGSMSSYGSRAQQMEEQLQELEEQVKNLNLELDTEKVKSAAKVLLLEQTVSDLRDELSMIKPRSTPKDVLEGVVLSWEVLDYPDLSNEEVE